MLKRKIALISPGKEGSVVSGRWKGIVNFYRLTLPLLYSLVPKGLYDIDVYDECVDDIPFDKEYGLVAMSVMTPYAKRAYEISKIFMKNGATVVLGGHHPTLMHDEAKKNCDVVVRGDAEVSWPKVLHDYARNELRGKTYSYQGIGFDSESRVMPDRSILKNKSLLIFNTVETSRGCPYSCEYCTVAGFYKSSYLQYTVESVISEIATIKGKFIFFVDDNLFGGGGDRNRAVRLLKALIPLKKKWFCQATIKIADDAELLSLAVQAGCMAVYLGLESLSKNSLSEVNKSWNKPESYIERIKKIRDAGIAIEAGIIFGFDDDTPDVFDSTAEFILKTGIESPNAHILTPYPGTPLFKRMEEQNRIITYDWNYYNTGHVVYKPVGMSEQCLMDGYKNWYRESFSVKKIVERMKKANFPYYALLTNIAKNHEVNRASFKRKSISLLEVGETDIISNRNPKEILEECYE